MSAQINLNEHVEAWGRLSREEYAPALHEEARAKGLYEREFARYVVKQRILDPKISVAFAEMLAHADEEVSDLLTKKLTCEAVVEAIKKNIEVAKAKFEAIRSEVATEREEAKLSATNRYVP
jgi:hypothetical protein